MRFLQDFTSYMVFRTFFILASTAFSILVVMLLLNIITIDEVAIILKLSPEATNALKTVFSRVHEVTGNLLDIISQLLNKLFSWAGVEIDLNKIKVDVNSNPGSIAPVHDTTVTNSVVPNAAAPAPSSDSGLIVVSPKK